MATPTSKNTGAAKKAAPAKKTTPKSTAGKVKANSDAAEGLRELFIDSLKDIYWAEKALVKTLPKMAKNATTESLIAAIEEHTEVTIAQVQKVESVFELLNEKAVAKKCEAMDGLIKEGQEIMESTESGPVRDAGIIAASQKIEHYEIATYGTLVAFAKTLGENEAAAILEEILGEEKEADSVLTDAAYNDINFEAAGEDGVESNDDVAATDNAIEA